MSTARTRILSAVLLVAGVLCLAGCPQRLTIEHINRDPGRYRNKEVAIAGRVVSSYGALGTGVFEVDDGTGRMWVFSQRYGVPGRDARLAVAGYIEQGFTAVKFGWGIFGEDPKLDVELVRAAREALGPDRDLLIDPGSRVERTA